MIRDIFEMWSWITLNRMKVISVIQMHNNISTIEYVIIVLIFKLHGDSEEFLYSMLIEKIISDVL